MTSKSLLFLLAVILWCAGSLHAQTEIELILVAHKDSLYAERHMAEVLRDPKNIVWKMDRIVLPDDEETDFLVSKENKINLAAYADGPEPSHELKLTLKNDGGTRSLSCKWWISIRNGNSTATEQRRYERFPKKVGTWNFSHFGAGDDQGRALFIGYRIKTSHVAL